MSHLGLTQICFNCGASFYWINKHDENCNKCNSKPEEDKNFLPEQPNKIKLKEGLINE